EVGGVECRRAAGAELLRGLLEANGVAGGEDDLRALDTGQPRGLEADACAAPDHDHGLFAKNSLAHDEPAPTDVGAAISARSALRGNGTISEKVGKGWIVSRRTSSGPRARIASVTCCSHSPASGPRA